MNESLYLCQMVVFLSIFVTYACFFLTWGKLDGIFNGKISYPRMVAVNRNVTELFSNTSNLTELYFYPSYHAKAVITLPHSNVSEPVEVWYNEKKKKSRIDYYDGDVKIYRNQNNGVLFKLLPRYDSMTGKHYIGCWRSTNKKKTNARSIIPKTWSWPFKGPLSSFKYIGDESIEGKLCTKWQFAHKMYEKNNVYTFWAEKTKPPFPVRYEMNGYDTLLTSYYDKYVIDYAEYRKWKYDDRIMDVTKAKGGSKCAHATHSHHGGGGDGADDFDTDPMAEFFPPDGTGQEDLTETEFHQFKTKHGKVYEDKHEHAQRQNAFRHNSRFIRSFNRQPRHFKLKLNAFADMTEDEYNMHKGDMSGEDEDEREEDEGKDENEKGDEDGDKDEGENEGDAEGEDEGEDEEEDEVENDEKTIIRKTRSSKSKKNEIHEHYKPRRRSPGIPKELDWRKYGAVSAPRGQANCGSCWAFAAVGAIEGANFVKTGKLVALSEQQLVDCTWKVRGVYKNNGNNGCVGGWAWKALFWAISNHLATRDSYGPYRGKEGYCKTKNFTVGAKMYGFRRVKRWNAHALRRAVAYHGPTAVSINSHPISLKFYSEGIYDDKKCSNSTDHAVLVIGYGQENGTKYWLIKNSWSPYWGNEGYIRIKEGLCGVTKKPVVVYNGRTKHYPWLAKKWQKSRKRHHRRKKLHRNKNWKMTKKLWEGKWLKLGK